MLFAYFRGEGIRPPERLEELVSSLGAEPDEVTAFLAAGDLVRTLKKIESEEWIGLSHDDEAYRRRLASTSRVE